MIGREDAKSNDLFYTCSLIGYIARKTKNKPNTVVKALGRERINRIYQLADVFHSDNIDRVSDDFIRESNITEGTFDNVGNCGYSIPSHWDIGKVYKRLILGISREKKVDIVEALFAAYESYISEKIEDYNSSVYYEIPENILNAFLEGKL